MINVIALNSEIIDAPVTRQNLAKQKAREGIPPNFTRHL